MPPLDLHVLSTPPAFILSQDQTLRDIFKTSLTSLQRDPSLSHSSRAAAGRKVYLSGTLIRCLVFKVQAPGYSKFQGPPSSYTITGNHLCQATSAPVYHSQKPMNSMRKSALDIRIPLHFPGDTKTSEGVGTPSLLSQFNCPCAADLQSFGLISGNKITSLIEGLSVISMTTLSMPIPMPPVGGIPYSSAVMKSSSMGCASSSPFAFSAT